MAWHQPKAPRSAPQRSAEETNTIMADTCHHAMVGATVLITVVAEIKKAAAGNGCVSVLGGEGTLCIQGMHACMHPQCYQACKPELTTQIQKEAASRINKRRGTAELNSREHAGMARARA